MARLVRPSTRRNRVFFINDADTNGALQWGWAQGRQKANVHYRFSWPLAAILQSPRTPIIDVADADPYKLSAVQQALPISGH